MFHYSYVKNFNRNAVKIEFSVLLFTFTYSLSQNIVKSHVSNYLNTYQENKQKTYLQLIIIRFQKLKTFFQILINSATFC
jgi:hypothetical protein